MTSLLSTWEAGRFARCHARAAVMRGRGLQGYVMRYRGHISRQTIKDVAFVGPGDCAVASGSDDGRMFIWDRYTGLCYTCCTCPEILPVYFPVTSFLIVLERQ